MTAPRIAPPRIGWPLLSVPDEHGRLHFPDLETSIRQTIEVLLRTRPGEQLMRPEFGGGLEAFVFEPSTLTTRRRMRDLILDTLRRWESRIELDRVEVWERDDEPSSVRVEIAYRVVRTGDARQLALTMELGG